MVSAAKRNSVSSRHLHMRTMKISIDPDDDEVLISWRSPPTIVLLDRRFSIFLFQQY